MDFTRLSLWIVIALFSASCATLNESECKTADWQMIGLEDGAKGRAASYIGQHRKACADYGITPELARYRVGHNEGLRHYCTEESGFTQGNAGNHYQGVCPVELRDFFLAGYEAGRELYLMRAEIRQLHNEANANLSELDALQQHIQSLEVDIVTGENTPKQRLLLLRELVDLQGQKERLESDTHNLELEAARKQGEYDVISSGYAN